MSFTTQPCNTIRCGRRAFWWMNWRSQSYEVRSLCDCTVVSHRVCKRNSLTENRLWKRQRINSIRSSSTRCYQKMLLALLDVNIMLFIPETMQIFRRKTIKSNYLGASVIRLKNLLKPFPTCHWYRSASVIFLFTWLWTFVNYGTMSQGKLMKLSLGLLSKYLQFLTLQVRPEPAFFSVAWS